MSEARNIKDYLHLYLGCEVLVQGEERKGYLTGVTNGGYECEIQYQLADNPYHLEEEPEFSPWEYVKPILRPLSDMTEEEAQDIYTIERDRELHPPTIDFDVRQRTDFGWVVTRLDHLNVGLLIKFDGVCYKVISEGKHPAIEPAMNQPLIFNYLLSKHFDLFGLIQSGLAIDKTKHLTPNL